jgi:hypothetical protein
MEFAEEVAEYLAVVRMATVFPEGEFFLRLAEHGRGGPRRAYLAAVLAAASLASNSGLDGAPAARAFW